MRTQMYSCWYILKLLASIGIKEHILTEIYFKTQNTLFSNYFLKKVKNQTQLVYSINWSFTNETIVLRDLSNSPFTSVIN